MINYYSSNIAVVVFDLKATSLNPASKGSYLRLFNKAFDIPQRNLIMLANGPFAAEQLLMMNSRTKMSGKAIFIQYEEYDYEEYQVEENFSYRSYVPYMDLLLNNKTTFPLGFDSLRLSINMCDHVNFIQVRSTADIKRLNPSEAIKYDSAIGLVTAPSSLSCQSFKAIENQVIQSTNCSSHCLMDYIPCDDMDNGFQLDVLAFQSSEEVFFSHVTFINDIMGWAPKSKVEITEGAQKLLSQLNSHEN